MLVRAALLVLLVLTAGCGGTVRTGSPATTVTPAPIPQTSAPPDSSTNRIGPPGIGPSGVDDASRLVEAHGRVLARESFTAHINSTRRSAAGNLISRYSRTIQFDADKDRFYYVLEQVNRAGEERRRQRVERWTDGEQVVQAVTVDGNRTSRVIREAEPGRSFPDNASNRLDLYRLLTVLDIELDGTLERDSRTEYRLVGGPQRVPPLRNVTFSAVVSDRGVIRNYRVAYTVAPNATRVTVTATYEQLGETHPSRPPWVGEED